MPANKVNGIKVIQLNTNDKERLKSNVLGYSSKDPEQAVIFELASLIDNFSVKKEFQWHFELQVETQFSAFDLNKIKEELDLQDLIDLSVTEFLNENCNLVKVASYLQDGYYHYHWYLSSNMLDLVKFEKWFSNQTMVNNRDLRFEVSKDPNWENIINGLVAVNKKIYGWSEYLSLDDSYFKKYASK